MGERGNALNRWLDRWLGIPLVGLTACIRYGARPTPPQRVGVLCLGAIGDLLLLSGLTSGLRRSLPQARLELLVSKANACAAPLIPGVNEYTAFGVRQVGRILTHVRQRKYDLLVDSSQWARLGALLCNLSGAACTVGFDTCGQHRAAGYSLKVWHDNTRHELENFLALGRAVFPDFAGAAGLRLPAEAPQDAALWQKKITRRTAFLHMWPSGYKACLKEWPARHWATLAKELVNCGFDVHLTGGPTDAVRNAAFLREHLSGCDHVHSLAGVMSLSGLAWLLARAGAVVSVNTGTMHLAALAGAPTVGLHGATNPLRWGPVGPRTASLLPNQGQVAYLNLGFEYPQGAQAALRYLPVEDVLGALKSLGAL